VFFDYFPRTNQSDRTNPMKKEKEKEKKSHRWCYDWSENMTD
jgi:hypothetical protein